MSPQRRQDYNACALTATLPIMAGGHCRGPKFVGQSAVSTNGWLSPFVAGGHDNGTPSWAVFAQYYVTVTGRHQRMTTLAGH